MSDENHHLPVSRAQRPTPTLPDMLDEVPKADNVFDTIEAHCQIKFQALNKTLMHTRRAMVLTKGIERRLRRQSEKRPLGKPEKPDKKIDQAKAKNKRWIWDMTKEKRENRFCCGCALCAGTRTWGGAILNKTPIDFKQHAMWSTYPVFRSN